METCIGLGVLLYLVFSRYAYRAVVLLFPEHSPWIACINELYEPFSYYKHLPFQTSVHESTQLSPNASNCNRLVVSNWYKIEDMEVEKDQSPQIKCNRVLMSSTCAVVWTVKSTHVPARGINSLLGDHHWTLLLLLVALGQGTELTEASGVIAWMCDHRCQWLWKQRNEQLSQSFKSAPVRSTAVNSVHHDSTPMLTM